MFLEISQNSQKNTCARVLFLIKLQTEACNFIKKETLTKVFSSEFCEVFKNTFSYRTFPVAASVVNKIFRKMWNDFCFWHLTETFMLRSCLFLTSSLKKELALYKPFHEYCQCDYLGVGYETSQPIGCRGTEKLWIN